MKSSRYDGNELRKVLAGMATDRVVCARIASQWKDGGLFDNDWANLVGGWCVKHLAKYDTPPNGQLTDIYERWANKNDVDANTAKGIERFLGYVSDDWASTDPPSSDYLLDVAGLYFNRVLAGKAIEEATERLEENLPAEAIATMANINRIELGTGSLAKPAEEYEPWRQAFDTDRNRSMMSFSDGLDRFFGDALVRGTLWSFMGPDKTGKSFWLLELAYRAIKARCRVAYFEAGDLMQDEVLQRLGQRVLRRPMKPMLCKFPTSIKKRIDENNKERIVVETKDRRFWEELTPSECFKAFRRVCRGRDMLRVSCYPNSTINVDGLRSVMTDWQREGWVADVMVLDYADILAPPSGTRDPLEQIDETWKQLRRMSQEFHCLLLTASQSNAGAYNNSGQTLTRKHFSGRKTKLAHVNGMIGINCTDAEKDMGVQRLNWTVRRSGTFRESKSVVVAGCLDVACPAMVSIF
ncbi:hypothetical protein M0R72_14780 [Candidatus Pacearchaeota archaeon]|jgi:hypothetical protein|nr:hypothetical protein [Candidatus Pacearchaeota archaeon]